MGELLAKRRGRGNAEHRIAVTAAEGVEDSAAVAVAAEVEVDNVAAVVVAFGELMEEEDRGLRLEGVRSIAVVDERALEKPPEEVGKNILT